MTKNSMELFEKMRKVENQIWAIFREEQLTTEQARAHFEIWKLKTEFSNLALQYFGEQKANYINTLTSPRAI